MTPDQFRRRWSSSDDAGGLSFKDMLRCAEEWELFPDRDLREVPLYEMAKAVLEAAECELPLYLKNYTT